MVLRNLLVISTSGIVLFSKEFINGVSKPGQLGGIITSMLTFSSQKTGLPVAYIELANIGVAITSHTEARVSCAVFHDSQDGSEFGKLMAKQLLDAFIHMFSSELHDRLSSPGSFDSFNSRISDVIRGSVRPVLEHLQEQRGINVAMLCSGDSVVYSSTEVDKISVLANHQALLGVATDLMAAQNDITSSLTLKSRRTTLILQRVERSSLIVVFKNSVDPSICIKEIDRSAHLLRQVLVMASNLKT